MRFRSEPNPGGGGSGSELLVEVFISSTVTFRFPKAARPGVGCVGVDVASADDASKDGAVAGADTLGADVGADTFGADSGVDTLGAA